MRQETEAGSALLTFSSQGAAGTQDTFNDTLTQLCDDILAESARSIAFLHQSPNESERVDNSVDKFNLLHRLLDMRTSLIVQVR